MLITAPWAGDVIFAAEIPIKIENFQNNHHFFNQKSTGDPF